MKSTLLLATYTLIILLLGAYWGGARVSGDEIEGYEADLTTARYEKAVSEWQNRGLRAQIRAYEREYPRKVVEALREAYRGQGGD